LPARFTEFWIGPRSNRGTTSLFPDLVQSDCLHCSLSRQPEAQTVVLRDFCGYASAQSRVEVRRGLDGGCRYDGRPFLVRFEISLGVTGADVGIECSGAARGSRIDLEPSQARRGVFCQLGLYGKPIPFDQDQVCYKELTVTGTNASSAASWPRALKLLAERRINTGTLISHRFSLRAWSSALSIAESKQGIKIPAEARGEIVGTVDGETPLPYVRLRCGAAGPQRRTWRGIGSI